MNTSDEEATIIVYFSQLVIKENTIMKYIIDGHFDLLSDVAVRRKKRRA